MAAEVADVTHHHFDMAIHGQVEAELFPVLGAQLFRGSGYDCFLVSGNPGNSIWYFGVDVIAEWFFSQRL